MATTYQCFDCGKVIGNEGIVRVLDREEIVRDEIVKEPLRYVCSNCGGRVIILSLS